VRGNIPAATKGEDMKKGFVLALAVFTLSLAAMASPKTKKQDFRLLRDSEIAGTELKAGQYQVSVDAGMATIYHGGKQVANFAVRAETVPQKFDDNAVVYESNGHSVLELRLAGSATKLRLEANQAMSGSASGKE
jgi:hypothetical protein